MRPVNNHGTGGAEPAPVRDGVGGHPCAVVHPHEARCTVEHHEPFEHGDDVVPGYGPLEGEGALGELVGDVELCGGPAVSGLVVG